MRMIQLKIFCMVFVNIALISVAPIMMMLANYRSTKEEVLKLSQNVFQTQINFSKILNMASVFNLNNQLQGISLHSYLLRKQLEKFSNDEFVYNQNYVPLVLNQEKVYKNQDDPIKTQIALTNQHHASNWYSFNTFNYDELESSSKTEIIRNDRLNYILRSYIHAYLNEHNSTINQGYQFFGYNSNGVFFSNYLNTTFSGMVDDPRCPKTKYPFNTRCRFWYMASKPQAGMVILPPMPIMSFLNTYEVVNLMCQRVKDRNRNLYGVFCKYMFVEDLRKFFTGYKSIITHQLIFDPYSLVAIFDSRRDLNVTKMTTLKEILVDKIKGSAQLEEFYGMIKANYSSRFIKQEREINYASSVTSDEFQKQIEIIDENGKSYVIIFNLLFLVDKVDKDVDDDLKAYNGIYKSKFNFLNAYILIDILSEEELMSFSHKILQQMRTVFIVTMVTLGVVSLIVLFVIFLYSLVFAHLINYPIDQLIKIFEQINLNPDDINECIIAQNTQFLDQEDELTDAFFSKDTRLLYESFTSLVKMLRYSALNLLKEDPSHTLLNLNIQISFFERFQNIHSLGMCHNNLANLHFLQGRYLEAMDHYEKSIVYAQSELNQYKDGEDYNYHQSQQRLSKFLSIQQRLPPKGRNSSQNKQKERKRNLSISQEINQNRKETYTGYFSRFEKQELYENLFNRKYNFFKCLNSYFELQTQEKQKKLLKGHSQFYSNDNEKVILDIFFLEELVTLANELLNIASKLLDHNLGREIIIRTYILEYELHLDRQTQADIQYDIIKGLYNRKLIDEKETQLTQEYTNRQQSSSFQKNVDYSQNRFSFVLPTFNQNKIQSAQSKIDSITQTTYRNLKTPKKQNNIRFSLSQQNDPIQKKSLSCNNSVLKKPNSIYQHQRLMIYEESNDGDIQEMPQIEQDAKNQRNSVEGQDQDAKYDIDSILQTQQNSNSHKKSQDKFPYDFSARNSVQSNQNLLAAQSPRVTLTLEQDSSLIQTPRKSQDFFNPQSSQLENGLTQIKMRDSCELQVKQVSEKQENSVGLTPKLTKILQNVQEGFESNRTKKASSFSAKKMYIDLLDSKSKVDQSIGSLYRQTSLVRKKISYTIEASPIQKSLKVQSVMASNFFRKYSGQRRDTHIDFKSLAYDMNSDILLSYTSIAQAKILLKKHKMYEAVNILTESLETQKYYSHKGKYKVLSLIYKILKENQINSPQLEGILMKFQELRIFKIAVVACCSRQKNRELSHWMINEIIQNILYNPQDGLGVINYRYGESHFQQLFKLLSKSYLKLNQIPISNQLYSIINYDCDQKSSFDILKKTTNFQNSTQTDQENNDDEEEDPYCFPADHRESIVTELDERIKSHSKTQNQFKNMKQMNNNNLPLITCEPEDSICTEELLSSDSKSERKAEIKNSYFNQLFHLSIKNAVNNIFFDKDLLQIEENKLYHSTQKSTSTFQINLDNTKLVGQERSNLDYQICKYIVIVIDLANIQIDEEFHLLCVFLYEMKIKLLILQLNEKECQEEKPKLTQEKINGMQVIQQFFSVEKLLKYLHEQRVNIKQLQVDYNIELY